MFEANDFWPFQEHSAQQLPNLSCMNASLHHAQQDFLPACMNTDTCMLGESSTLPMLNAPAYSILNLQEANGSLGFRSVPPRHIQNLFPNLNFIIEGKSSVACCGLSGKPVSNMVKSTSEKKYLIFDQCGNNTKMMYSPFCLPSVYPITAAMKDVYNCELDKELPTTEIYGYDLIKPSLHDECDENHVSSKESDMHEDTEEINALLYSDDDEDFEEDDEVMSTGHSPNVPKRYYEELEQFDNLADEVDSCCVSKKRQKVFHGEDKETLLAKNESTVNLKGSYDYHSDAESNIQEENINSSSENELPKKTKMRETLRMLKGIIPGAEGKDPSLIIDEAIDYLKSLKHRAMNLGVHSRTPSI